jgi:cytochrome oxidase assembly protein ShyY1
MIIEHHTGYAVGWFTLSFINAGLAESKGRSKAGWWFASLFIGPIATLIIRGVTFLPVSTSLRPSFL